MNLTTKPYTETDQAEFNSGFDAGNYSSAYETNDYAKSERGLIGQNGFWRIGHLLGFFSSYELEEIHGEIHNVDCRDEVKRYRAEFKDWL